MGGKSMTKQLSQRRQMEQLHERQGYLKGWSEDLQGRIEKLEEKREEQQKLNKQLVTDVDDLAIRLQRVEERLHNLSVRSSRPWWKLWGR